MVSGYLSWEAIAHELLEEEWQRIDQVNALSDALPETLTDAETDAETAAEADVETVHASARAGAADDPGRQATASLAPPRPTADPELASPDTTRLTARLTSRVTLTMCDSPHRLLPELVRLLRESHDRPVAELEPAIRELVTEQQFIDAAGDPVADPWHETQEQIVQVYVALLMRVFDRLRQRTRQTTGPWADMPTTPQMFG